ncbi:MAG: hypothetical protein V4773_26725 [Verrucomicrobiota bacterium]
MPARESREWTRIIEAIFEQEDREGREEWESKGHFLPAFPLCLFSAETENR